MPTTYLQHHNFAFLGSSSRSCSSGGDPLRRAGGQCEERHHLGQPLLHPVPRRAPRQGDGAGLRGGRLRRRERRRLAQGRIHLSE